MVNIYVDFQRNKNFCPNCLTFKNGVQGLLLNIITALQRITWGAENEGVPVSTDTKIESSHYLVASKTWRADVTFMCRIMQRNNLSNTDIVVEICIPCKTVVEQEGEQEYDASVET